MTVWPDRQFYSEIKEEDLDEIADQVLEGKEPLERLKGKAEPDVEEMVWTMLDSPY